MPAHTAPRKNHLPVPSSSQDRGRAERQHTENCWAHGSLSMTAALHPDSTTCTGIILASHIQLAHQAQHRLPTHSNGLATLELSVTETQSSTHMTFATAEYTHLHTSYTMALYTNCNSQVTCLLLKFTAGKHHACQLQRQLTTTQSHRRSEADTQNTQALCPAVQHNTRSETPAVGKGTVYSQHSWQSMHGFLTAQKPAMPLFLPSEITTAGPRYTRHNQRTTQEPKSPALCFVG
jgi:hypothetical protein